MEKEKLNNEEMETELELEEEEYEEVEYTGPSGLSLALNRYFHHLDRGGTLGGEVMAGIAMFFLSICVIFMNMQVVGNAINGELQLVNAPDIPTNIQAAMTYTQLYVGSILVAIIGSLLMGIVARLPFTQLSVMGLASSLLCLVGTEAGLTWQNLLFINLISGVLYAVVCGVPKIRLWLYNAVPGPVRKAFPAALGLVIALYALKMTGLVTLSDSGAINGVALTDLRELMVLGLIGAAVAVGLYVLMCVLKRKHRIFWPLMGGTLVFVLLSVLMNGIDTSNTESYINFGRIWLIAGSQASQITPFADSYLTYSMKSISAVFANLGQVVTAGADFSGYTGNTIVLILCGVVSYVFAGLFSAQGVLLGAQDRLNENAEENVELESEEGMRKALVCNAAANVIAPFLGTAGVTLGVSSVAAAKDNAKSGIASITACIGFIISLFVMAFPALFATQTYEVPSMNTWNYFAYGNGGIVYLIQGAVFTVVDAVMICVGVSMAASLKKLNWKDIAQWIPAVVTVLAAVLTSNLVAGAAAGCLISLILSLVKDRKSVNIPMIVVTVLLVAVVVLL